MRFKIAVASACLALAACGGSQSTKPATHPAEAGADPGEEKAPAAHGKEAHEQLPPQVKAFHDVLAPLWHAEKGPKRTSDTCKSVGELKMAALAIEDAPVPEEAASDAEGWKKDARALTASVGGLEGSCNQDGNPEFEVK